jgi:hypothetical protein
MITLKEALDIAYYESKNDRELSAKNPRSNKKI